MGKERLDALLVRRGLAATREQARRLILAGQVRVEGRGGWKPGSRVAAEARLEVEAGPRYVSRGGLKLEAALARFGVDPSGLVCLDVGASTGGFTDCLLQHGAARVYAVDVGHGQLHYRLRQDPRVVVMERTHARYLQSLPEKVDLSVVDVSFISLTLVLPAVSRLLAPRGQVIALVKPQFEAGREKVERGGVVRDRRTHRQVLERLAAAAAELGLGVAGLMPSPLRGPAGNVEFLVLLRPSRADPGEAIERALEEAAAG